MAQLAVTTVLGTTAEWDFGETQYAMIYVPSRSRIRSLTFYAASEVGGTYFVLRDTSGNDVALTVSGGGAYPVPSACQGVGAIKMVGDVADNVELSSQL